MPDQQPPVSSLPDRPRCVDREDVRARVIEWQSAALSAGSPCRVLLTGPQGIGKTTVAVDVSYELTRDYPDGQLFCDCRGSDTGLAASSTELARNILSQLGIPAAEIPEGVNERHALVRRLLSGRRILIVFDDVADANQVQPLLGDLRRAAVIITGRNRLRKLEQAGFESVELLGFTDTAAAELVAAIGGPTAAALPPELVAKLRAACGGLPLALAATAWRLGEGDEPPGDLIARLEMASALDEFLVDEDLVVKRVFDDTYRVLAVDQAVAYRRLGLAAGPEFDLLVVSAVLGRPVVEVRQLLEGLVRRFILRKVGGGWYRFHDLIRLHAAALAQEHDSEDDRDAVTLCGLDVQAIRAVALDRVISERPDPHGALRWYTETNAAYTGDGAVGHAITECDRRWVSLLAAARTAGDVGAAEHAVVLAVALYTFAYDTGRSRELIGVYLRAVDFAADPSVYWQLYRDLAGLYERIGDSEADRYLVLAKETGYAPGLASVVEWQAIRRERLGKLDEALELLVESKKAIPLMANPDQERAYALNSMHTGRVHLRLGQGDVARAELTAPVAYFARTEADLHNAARCNELLGDLAWAEGDQDTAIRNWEPAEQRFAARRMAVEARLVLDKLIAAAEMNGRESDAERYRERRRSLEGDDAE